MHLLARLLLPILLLAAPDTTMAALRGQPLMQRFGPDDYDAGPNTTGVAIDAEGRLVAANQDGLVMFDGAGWRSLVLPGRRAARDVGLGPDGRLYVASIDQFGVLEESPEGDLVYRDLRAAFGLDSESSRIGIVWDVAPTPDGVWFRADNELFFYAMVPGGHRRIPLTPDARGFKWVEGELYGRIEGVGLVRLRGDRFEPEPGAEVFAHQALPGIVPWGDSRLLIGGEGFYLADAEGIRPLRSAADELFRESGVVTADVLDDGSIVIGTRAGEVQRYGRDLRLLDRVPLGNVRIHAFTADSEGGLWAGTQNGLVRMRLPARWSRFGEAHGLQGTILDVEWHDGALWLAGTNGLLRLAENDGGTPQAERLPWVDLEAYAVRSTAGGLLVGHRNGLFALAVDGRREALVEGPSAYFLVPSRYDPGRLYAQGLTDVWMLRLEDGRWTIAAHWPLPDMLARRMVETATDEIWISDRRGGPQRLRFDPVSGRQVERRAFEAADGLLLDGDTGSDIYHLDGRLHAVSGDRGYVLDGERFVRDEGALFKRIEHPMELQVVSTPIGTIAYTRRQMFVRAPGSEAWRPMDFGDSRRGFHVLRVGSDGVIRLSTWSGQVLQYDPAVAEPPAASLRVALESAEVRRADGGRQRLPVRLGDQALELATGSLLMLRAKLPTMEPDVRFRIHVEGISEGWSDWSGNREFGLLVRPGEFPIRIQARTRSGREVAELELRMRGEARWHETTWARILGAAAGVAMLLALVAAWLRWRTRRYAIDRQRLEERIAERTQALEEANRQLAELAVEDPVTGVANRRALEQALRREWRRCLDLHQPLTLLMIDVDHFKRYNDAHGHPEGDAALRDVAAALSVDLDAARDLLARYGGEEFALLLPGARPDDARLRAERLRAGVEDGARGLTVSIGIASMVPTRDDALQSLIKAADEALYRAKHRGRNRVEVAGGE